VGEAPGSASPFEDLSITPEQGLPSARLPQDVPTPAPAGGGANPGPTAGPAEVARPAVDAPLPSKEETERQIREEAARKQQELDDQFANQREDLDALRDEERSRFRDELRRILEAYGNRAGHEIEKLSVRSGRDEDPKKQARALRVIWDSHIAQKTKVQKLRAIGIPETVILDYLANTLDRELGAKNGPRTRNEVWVRAARLLLIYEPGPPRSAQAPQASTSGDRGRPAAQRSPAGPSSSAGDARPH
jgi:hypothetical protein